MPEKIAFPYLKEKIAHIRSALFFSQHNHELKLPTNLVNIIQVDEEHHVWFYINKPVQSIGVFDQVFPARLDIFKKGGNEFLQVSGNASLIVENPVFNFISVPEINWDLSPSGKILVKMKMVHVKYFNILIDQKKPRRSRKSWFSRFNWVKPYGGSYFLENDKPLYRLDEVRN